ncbi:MAG: protein kinase, partial [Acidimicrobiales bacterium]
MRLLGAGAFAAVYAARDPALDAIVAVKVLGDNHCVDPEVRARFIKEARLLRRVGTSRLVPVFDIGEQDGQPYFVM